MSLFCFVAVCVLLHLLFQIVSCSFCWCSSFVISVCSLFVAACFCDVFCLQSDASRALKHSDLTGHICLAARWRLFHPVQQLSARSTAQRCKCLRAPTCLFFAMLTSKQTYWQTNKQTNKQTASKQTNKQTSKQPDKQAICVVTYYAAPRPPSLRLAWYVWKWQMLLVLKLRYVW